MKTSVFALALAATLLPFGAKARDVTSLNATWQFVRADNPAVKDPAYDGHVAWQTIDLPHSFNAHDVRAAGDRDAVPSPDGPYRGAAWYRHELDFKPEPGKHYYLQFDGATLAADVYVNGQSIGRHEGGYAAFRFDVTNALKAGANLIAVRVDNTKVPQIAPLAGDFNIFGGLTRGVSLIAVPDVHVDLKDHGGPGVYVTTQKLYPAVYQGKKLTVPLAADVSARALIANEGAAAAVVTIRARVVDADGKTVAQTQDSRNLPAGTTAPLDFAFKVKDTHLWEGRKSPYLYHIEIDTGTDKVIVPLGIRTLTVAKDGFRLNGALYAVHGVNMQQPGRPGKGTGVSDADIDQDMQLLGDLGLTGMRLAHMQHPQRVYDDADKLGILVSTEVPLVNDVTPGDAFLGNINEQMRELIAQNYNHPSVAMWGLGNELRDNSDAANAVIASLQTTAKAMDPKRPTLYSHCCLADDAAIAMHGDITSYNRYYGWYTGEFTDIGKWADGVHARFPDRVFAMSEYGAGASVKQQEDPVSRVQPGSTWHPEQYQAKFHEVYWKEFAARPWLVFDFVWVGIDFPAWPRNEGDRPWINDKGLVTEDRTTKKDAYYFYQANWSDKPMVHITSERFLTRRVRAAVVKVYTNTDKVDLTLNGQALPPQPVTDHIATWKIDLADGDNEIVAAIKDSAGKDLRDTVHWTYTDKID
jgi:beta-galactosidase